ncbi:GAF domain-containing protein [Siphonobacter sp. BAB-5405]|uniref:GAF domain-containing protein n=1 Tax=Siphonobacter sp. BAB-5405 TaxID=1864825 RepID=UPI0018EB8C82|nr:GAF domain-containing protein [Siphonobacter sp. BAB-5405]
MDVLDFESPFQIQLSFATLLDRLHEVAQGTDAEKARSAQVLLTELAPFPEFREGITSADQVEKHANLIRRLLKDYFPPELTDNEIKAVSIPFLPIIFNHTERFKKILAAAGTDFEMGIRDFDAHQFYVLSCCIILNDVYGTKLDFAKPLFYDIPTAEGILRHYRILYNADFLDTLPTEQALPLSQAEIEELLDNYDNLELWKAKFPPNSWLIKGFALMVLYDATVENAISLLKEKLLGSYQIDFHENLLPIFHSIFNSKSLRIGFAMYNAASDTFTKAAFGEPLPSFILSGHDSCVARQTLCLKSYQKIVQQYTYFAVADTLEYTAHSLLIEHLNQQHIRSFILAPVVKNQQLWGVLEVVSSQPREFNSINALKLDVLMPFLTETIDRMEAELQNHIQAFIQNVYTTIHPSVYWKFRQEALAYRYHQQAGQSHTLAEIAFPDVHPLYGQVDVKGSSEARNLSTQKDLQTQLEALQAVLDSVAIEPIEKQQIAHFLIDISQPLQASTEPYITAYLDHRIHPQLRMLNEAAVDEYFRETNLDAGRFITTDGNMTEPSGRLTIT